MAHGKYLPSTSLGIPNITRILIPLTPGLFRQVEVPFKERLSSSGLAQASTFCGVWSECFVLGVG